MEEAAEEGAEGGKAGAEDADGGFSDGPEVGVLEGPGDILGVDVGDVRYADDADCADAVRE